MKKNNLFFIVLLVLLVGGFSCEDTRLDDISDPTVYIPANGEIEQVIFSTGEPYIYRLGVYKSGVHETIASATVVVMSETELQVYNAENKTNYEKLPDNCFELRGGSSVQVNFSKESRLEFAEIEILYDEIKKITDFDAESNETYVIPVMLTHADISVGNERQTVLIKPIIKEPNVYFSSLESSIKIESVDEPYSQTLRVAVDFSNLWDITVEIDADEEAVEAYNAQNGTQYKLLPASAYTFTPVPVTINVDENFAEFEAVLNTDNVDYDDFLLPISIKQVSRFSIDEDRSTHYMTVSRPAERMNREGWSIADFSSEEAVGEGAGQGTAANVLDGNTGTFWHSEWAYATGQLPHHITIDMQKEVTVAGIDLQRRVNNSDTRAGNFYISSDNQTFTLIGSFEMAAVNEAQTFKVNTSNGRYLKVEITESNRAPFANLAEVYIRGVE